MKRFLAFLLIASFILSMPMNVEAASKKLNKTRVTLHVGQSVTLSLRNGRVVSWRSNNRRVATVSAAGVVTAKKKGTANLERAKTTSPNVPGKGACIVITKRHAMNFIVYIKLLSFDLSIDFLVCKTSTDHSPSVLESIVENS